MPLLKGGHASDLVSRAIVLDLADLEHQAATLMEQAQLKAGEVLARGRNEAQHLIDEAEEKGHSQGLAKGLEEGRTKGQAEGRAEALKEFCDRLEAIEASWSQALEQWEADRSSIFQEARADVLAFASALARKVVYRIIECDPTVIEEQLHDSLALVSGPTAVHVRAHPDDCALLEEVLPSLTQHFRECGDTSLHPDDEIERGGCIVTTRGGTIDATIQMQIDRIVAALLPDADTRFEKVRLDGAMGSGIPDDFEGQD